MTVTAEHLLLRARQRIRRVGPHELGAVLAEGGLVVDIRPAAQRASEGELPGAVVVERNVLEWRLDPNGDHRLPEVSGVDQRVVIVCSAGYASSLAAATVAELGYAWIADLVGGYQAWRAWFAPVAPAAPAPAPTVPGAPAGAASAPGAGQAAAPGVDGWRLR